MNQEIIVLPEEVKNMALQISDEKKNEVQTILTQIFTGTADWEKQVDSIEVKGVDDVMGIQLADTARKNIKTARLHAEKLFDSKRDEVQARMQNDKLEDALWLKSKQIMILKFKAIEDKAKFKAETVQRYEAEQKELKTQKRISEVQKFKPDINRLEIENLSDELYSTFIHGLEKEYNDRIEAEKKAEAERIAKEKKDAEERERIKKELEEQKAKAEKLRKEAEIREREMEIERKKQADILAKQKAESDRAKKEQEAKLERERKEREKLEREIKAKKDAEFAREKAEKEAQKKAEKAPDKDKLLALAETVKAIPIPTMKTEEAAKIIYDVTVLIGKLRRFIIDKANEL